MSVDYEAIQRIGSWLVNVEGVKGLVVLGHAGEGTFLTEEEQVLVIKAFVKSVDNRIPIIAGITREGDYVAGLEAKRAKEAGAAAGLLYPSHGWLRFGYQEGAPQARYKSVYEASGLPLILFQYPDVTKATYNLQTQLDILAQPGVFASEYRPFDRLMNTEASSSEERCPKHATMGPRDQRHPKAAPRDLHPHLS